MSREILFKGRTKDGGNWVYGDLIHRCCGTTIGTVDSDGLHEVYVDEEIICQYTGLTDKNGCKIWEGDVVEFEDTGEEGYEYKEGFDFINKARVEFAEARWSLTDFASTNSAVVDEMYNHVEFMDFWQYCKVIGNIFDNADLLGE